MKNFLLRRLLSATYVLLGLATVQSVWAQTPVSLTAINAPYTQDFNTLAASGTSSTVPMGFTFVESGSNNNTSYEAGTGSNNEGNTYSFGATNASERAFGGLRSGSLNPVIGASFVNNTGTTINSINITYTGEQWRLGSLNRVDRLDFQYSTNATSLTIGTYTDFDALDFTAPKQTGNTGALNGNNSTNSAVVTALITGLSIPAGGTFWVRFNDFAASGAQDGLAIDDFSLTPTCPNITATLTGTSTICAGSSTTLAATITGGTSPYTVRVNDGTNNSIITNYTSGSAITVTPTTSKTYTIVSVRDANNCTATVSGTATVTVETITAAITNLASDYCKNAPPVTLTGTPTGSDFTSAFTINGATATVFDPASLTVGNHTVVYSVTNTTGCSSTTSQTVRVRALPTPNITGLANNYCKDAAPVSLTGTPSGGAFTIDGAPATGFDPATLATGQSYTVVYSVTNVNGCSAATSETFKVRPLPVATLTSSNSLNCAITSTTLSAGTGTGYTYAFSGPGLISSDPVSGTATANLGGTYSVTVTSGFGCTAVNTTMVVSDVASPTATITGTLTVCTGLGTTLTASGGTSYTWSTGETTAAVSVTAGTYSVTVTAGNGCTALASATVTPVANPTATIGGTLTVITGGSTTLTASGGTSFTWSTGETTASVSVTAGTYSVTVANASNCVSSTTATVIEVNTTPVATANNNQTATVGLAFSYTVNAFTDAETPNSLTYSASINPANGFTFDPATRVIAGTPPALGVSSVTVTATDFGGLSASTTFTITVSPPTCGTLTVPGNYSTIQSAINAACEGAVIQVTAGTYIEQLTIPKNLTILGGGVGTTFVKAPGNLTASVLASAPGGGANNNFTLIEVNSGKIVTIAGLTVQGQINQVGGSNIGDDRVNGIHIIQGANLTLTNVSVVDIIDQNRATACPGPENQRTTAIRVGAYSPVQFTGQLTTNNVTVSNYGKTGIIVQVTGSNAAIANTTISGRGSICTIAQNGIQIDDEATATITSSTITGNNYTDPGVASGTGVLLAFTPGVVSITNSTLSGNDNGIASDGTDAVGNTTISGNTFSNNELVQLSTNSVPGTNTFDKRVTNNNKPGSIYSGIQVAVDDATAGDVISVGAGTYVENVTIPKSLTLLGANAGINPNTGSRVAETIVLPATTGATDAVYPASVVTVFSLTGSAGNVLIDGFTLDGANPAISDPIKSVTLNGVEIDAAAGISGSGSGVTGGTVRNNIIKNFAYDGVDFSGEGTPTFNTITNNSFDNIAYVSTKTAAGVAMILADNGYASITSNVATRVRAGVQTNNFFQPSPGPVPTIATNNFTAYRYGIFHNLHSGSATGFTIATNTITGDAPLSGTTPLAGIAISSLQGTTPVTISGNTVSAGFPYGIEAWNTTTTGPVVVSGGSVQGSVAGVRVTNRNRFGDADGASKLLVSGVTISNSPVGVLTFDDPAAASGLTAMATVTDNTQITGSGAFTAVAISGSDANATITGNASSFVGNGSGVGVDVNGGTASVMANRITNFATGISVSNGGQLTGATNNFITTNTNGLVYEATAGATQGVVTINDLSGNTGKAIINGLTSTTINASCNYFGAPSATINPTYVTGNVSTTQVLANNTDEDGAAAGFQNTSCFTPPTAPVLTVSPAPQLGPNTSYCIGENPTVTTNYTTGTNSFTVQSVGSGSTTVTTGNSVTITQGADTYYVYATNTQNGYTSPVSSTYVQIQPVVTSFTSNKAAYCVGETVSLSALGCNVATVSQPNLYFVRLRQLDGSGNTNQGTAGLASGATSYSYTQFATTAPLTYTITAECVNGGTGQVCGTTSLAITANPLPVATLVSSNTLTCAAPTATLTAGGGQTYVFDGPGIVSQNGSATALVNAAGPYSVTVTSAAGCVSTTTTTVFSDTAVPTATLMASNSLNCAVTSATLTANASGGTSYTYTFSNGAAQIGTTNQAVATAGGPYSVTVTTANGCSTVATTTIMSDTAAPAVTLVSNNTLTCSVTSATLTATGGVSYAFSGSGLVSSDPVAGTAVVNASGMYSVTATAANGCFSTTTTSVISNTAAPMATLTTQGSSTLTCAQTSVTLVAGGGVSYAFSGTGIISQDASGTAVVDTRGVYSVTATAANGCTDVATVRVFRDTDKPTATLATVGSSTLTCAQTSVTLTASATGSSSYSYAFSTGAFPVGANQATVSTQGLYSVTVTGANGCTDVANVRVYKDTDKPTATLATVGSSTLTCAQTSVTLTASATGSSSYTYAFSAGAFPVGANQATVSTQGLYSVTVTGANGCTDVANVRVYIDTDRPTATLATVGSSTLTCAQTSVTLTASATGSSSYTYAFSAGATPTGPNQATVTTAGLYSVTVTGTNGCTDVANVRVYRDADKPTATLATAGSSTLTCAQTSVTLTASATGSSSYTYAFSAGAFPVGANQATVSTQGLYSVTVTGANGCTDVANVRVYKDTDKPTATLATQGSNTLTCAQTSVTLVASATGGTAPYTYLFSPDATTITATQATVTTAGLYSVTATGANGCFDVATIRVFRDTDKPVASLSVLGSATLTCNQTTATLSASATGSSSYTYAFSAGATSGGANQATVTTAGLYSVTVTGANGCTDVANVRVYRDTDKPTATLATLGSATLTCAQTSVTLTASATGSSSYTYAFSAGATPTGPNQATVTTAGLYSVTVTGTNGCTDVANVRVYKDTDKPTATLATQGSSTLTCAQTSVTLVAGGGVSYAFSGTGIVSQNGSATAVVNMRGVYSVTATAANGCTDVATIRISSDTDKPTASLATVGGATITCNQPSVTLTASATGSSSYTYAFSAGATPVGPNQATVSTPGVYTVTVTGANGCTDVATERVFRDNARPTASLMGTTTICAGGTANLVATVSGGTTPYSLTYSDGTSASAISNYTSGTNIPVSPTATSTYTIAVSGANGCTATITGSGATVTVNPLPNASLTTQGSSTLTCAQTSVTLVAGGGASYAFAGPGIVSRNGNTAIVNAAGMYSVTVTSAAGCSAVSTTMVSTNTVAPTVSLVSSGTISCSSPSVTLTANTGTRTDTYAFAGPNGTIPSMGNTAVVSTGGVYSVTATSTNGCFSTTTTTVASDTAVPSATLVVSGAITCASPTATLTANPATRSGTDTYAFSGPSGPVSSTGNTATVMATGTYSVTVTSSNGCLSTATATVVSNTAVSSLTLVSSNNLSCTTTSATLTANLDPTGSRSVYTYAFSSGATQISNTNQATVTTAGLYSVTATASNGCSSVASTSVTSDTAVTSLTLTSSNNLSCGVTSATLTASPDPTVRSAYTYVFSAGATQINANQATITTAGLYSVTATSVGNGCSVSATTSVTSSTVAPTVSLVSSGTISCASPSVTLTANTGTRTDTYAFAGPNGTIPSMGNTAVVSTGGVYSVTATSTNGCFSTTTTTVASDTAVPSATLVVSGAITCASPTATLTANPATRSGTDTYAFSGPSGPVSSTGNTATVMATGTYSVTVTSSNGCLSTASTSVTSDTAVTSLTLTSSNNLSCGVTSATLTANLDPAVRVTSYSYVFSPGATQIGTSNRAIVTTGGPYSVTATSVNNGCSVSATTNITSDTALPTATLSVSNSLNCGVTSATLTATGGNTYAFSGPGLGTVTGNTATVTTGGLYSVTVTATSGCSAIASVNVISDVTSPTATLSVSNSLNCGVTSATLTATGGNTYAFSGPGLGTVMGNTATVTTGGIYSVTVTATSGCSAIASVNVISNTAVTTPTITGLASSFCKNDGPVTLTGSPAGGSFAIDGTTTTTLNPAILATAQHTVTYSFTNANQCSATASQTVMINDVPQSPVIQTQSGQSNVTVSQNTGDVVLFVSGCTGGTITWSGGAANSITVSTANTGVFTYTATCQANGCTSAIAVATVTVGSTSLRVLHRDASNGNLNTNAIYPYLLLDNVGTTPIPYSELTVRYYLTVENPAPVTNLSVYNASFGAGNVHLQYVPLNPVRNGATGYVEYSFTPAAGSLGAMSNSGSIDNAISKQDYSAFNQADDYSYVLNRDFTPNTHITAYRNGVLIWGTEPAGTPGVVSSLSLTASANPTAILTTGSTTLSASASGGTPGYSYTFSGPGTIQQNGSTATVSGLPAGVQTFTIVASDVTAPVNQTVSTTVSVTVNTPTPVVVSSLSLTASANPTAILTTGSTTLSASASGGTPGYSYTFSGPGTIQQNGSTATVSGLPAGVQTFTVFVSDATSPVSQTISAMVSVTVTVPANTAPTTTPNANQTGIVGTAFSYTVNPFTDAETPNSLTYASSIAPANGLTYNPVTRVLSGTPVATGTSSVTLTATDPGGLSTSTIFTVTVNAAAPVVTTNLRVLHRDASNGNLNTNAIYPYFILDNQGSSAIPYGEITVRYWLTVENPAPVTNLPVYSADFGAANVSPLYVAAPRQGATGYVQYSFSPAAGNLNALSNSGAVNTAISKQDYSAFDQSDDYSYVLNRDFTPNAKFTAYRNGVLIWGTEPAAATRLAAEHADEPLRVEVLGNPIQGGEMAVKITGATGQPLRLRVTDLSGHLVSERTMERAGAIEQHRLSVSQQAAGILLLQVSTPTQTQTVKVLKVD